jgi:SAM-dependent methyltransferase
MRSKTRIECDNAVATFANVINSKLIEGDLLYVGIAGDPPGGEYSNLFNKFNIKTFDADPIWRPDIIGDITKTNFEDNSWDVIVCVQVIEHVKNIWDIPQEMRRILKPGGMAIIDTPFMYPYHAEPPSFGDYWRLTKDGMRVLFESCFNILDIISTDNLTSCLIQKSNKI